MSPAQRRASDVMRSATTAARRDVLPADVTARPAAPDAKTRYTVDMPATEAAEFDALVARARQQLGRRVDKSAMVRALLALAGDDRALFAQVLAELPRYETPRGRRAAG